MNIDFRSLTTAAAVVRHELASSAMLVAKRGALFVALLACLACSNNLGPTAKWKTFGHASAKGVARSDEGAPPDSVSVRFEAPPGRGVYGGGAQPPLTGPDGTFEVAMDRVTGPEEYAQPSPIRSR